MEIHNPKHKFRAWLPLDKIDPAARDQIHNLAQVPGIHRWIAIMPDVHPGFGMPIGGVAALIDYIIPNAVGVDIGCGVLAIETNLDAGQVRGKIPGLLQQFLDNIPVGFNKRRQPLASSLWQDVPDIAIIHREVSNARLQLGTLGGGNHFIELQRDCHGAVWLMLHSGSRNLGKQVADLYNREAQKHCHAHNQNFPPGLAWLPLNSPLGKEYFAAMQFCVAFAAENRRKMADICLDIMARQFPGCHLQQRIETIHNYAAREHHYQQEVIVHRKGAVLARDKVVIPGSMGTASYIGQGLENPQSFCSCSHGAGRVLGRKEAKRTLDSNRVFGELREKGVVLLTPDKGAVVEEASMAYKDIEEVMAYQQDLVRPLIRLEPMGVVKG